MTPPSELPAGLEGLVGLLREDIDTVLHLDPAARHALEVLLVYPGLHALWTHRLAHLLWRRGYITLPRWIAHVNRRRTGIEIHPGARFGRRVFIDHGMGIVIGETATVGDDCLLYKGVVLGGTSLERKVRHPTLGRGVVVGTNASVLGPIQLGDGAKVGSSSVVIRDVPAGATVVGVPGRVVNTEPHGARQVLDHADLPDPVAQLISRLLESIESLERRLSAVEAAEAAGTHAGRLGGRRSEHDVFEEELA
jgi:serine O-acetyltransferase